MRTFLIGGGRGAVPAHEPFARAARGPVVAYVLDDGRDTDRDRWSALLTDAGVTEVRVVVVSAARPPAAADLDGAGGVYVAGGLTPAYREVLVGAGTGWLDTARTAGLPYAGFSAGAAIAATDALVGGWHTTLRGRRVVVCDAEVGEGMDPVTVLPGLGLVPFTVEVHAAQWGTLNRLAHALLGADPPASVEGWAIDEDTALEVDGAALRVHGTGAATRLVRTADRLALTVHLAGEAPPRGESSASREVS